VVTITPTAFRFSIVASITANLSDIHWMRIHVDPNDRLVVFEPVPGLDKVANVLKLGTQRKGLKTLVAKGLISNTPWIRALVEMPIEARKFEMKRYSGPLPTPEEPSGKPGRWPWYIQLMPAFEEAIAPSEINRLGSSAKGIYRYRGGNDGEEVIYIGKGSIRDRFLQEPTRRNWDVTRIEYSIVQDDQKAYEWEAWWIQRFRKENNGLRPRFNVQDGHG